ncbi:winged helix-turn-helix domain-containing protein, partial [Bacillus safensis]
VLSRDIILDRVWGYESDVSIKTIDATVKLLRKKLEKFNKQDLIQSIRGVGYKIES